MVQRRQHKAFSKLVINPITSTADSFVPRCYAIETMNLKHLILSNPTKYALSRVRALFSCSGVAKGAAANMHWHRSSYHNKLVTLVLVAIGHQFMRIDGQILGQTSLSYDELRLTCPLMDGFSNAKGQMVGHRCLFRMVSGTNWPQIWSYCALLGAVPAYIITAEEMAAISSSEYYPVNRYFGL